MKIWSYLAAAGSILMWPLAIYGFSTLMAEPGAGMSRDEIYLYNRLLPGLALSASVLLFFATSWLSGYCIKAARWPSLLAAASNFGFLVAIVFLFLGHG